MIISFSAFWLTPEAMASVPIRVLDDADRRVVAGVCDVLQNPETPPVVMR